MEIHLGADPALLGKAVFMGGNGSCVHAFLGSIIHPIDGFSYSSS